MHVDDDQNALIFFEKMTYRVHYELSKKLYRKISCLVVNQMHNFKKHKRGFRLKVFHLEE